ncbi:MAG: phospho-N-acetylmuramoyl-pentapeptide-transferase, partial [Clostridium sp.]|nr:phospho-N-acetylmuramoyl-pentapeptide-transferase [Clostridium sp.]
MALRDTILALFAAFAVTAGLCPYAIPFLHRLKFGQQVRDDGPQSHLKKQGTPTMGGIVFIIAIIAVGLIYGGRYPKIIPVLLLTVGFGIVGFVDD